MFNMNIKPRRAELESGTLVQHKETGQIGFVIDNDYKSYQVVIVEDDGTLKANGKITAKTDKDKLLDEYKVIAERNEYIASIDIFR